MKLTDSKIQIDIATAGIKKCKKCNEEYPATLGYFYQAKGNTGGLVHICKRCRDNKTNHKEINELKSLNSVKEIEELKKKKHILWREKVEVETLSKQKIEKLEEQIFDFRYEVKELVKKNFRQKEAFIILLIFILVLFGTATGYFIF